MNQINEHRISDRKQITTKKLEHFINEAWDQNANVLQVTDAEKIFHMRLTLSPLISHTRFSVISKIDELLYKGERNRFSRSRHIRWLHAGARAQKQETFDF